MRIFGGLRPDITPAQVTGLLVAGVPILANLLAAFGIFHPTPEQQDALIQAAKWGGVGAGTLFLGDAHLRSSRARADAHVQAAAMVTQQPAGEPALDPGVDIVPDTDLPSDATEFGAGQLPPGS